MKTYHVLTVFIATVALFSATHGASEQDCRNVPNPDCSSCLKVDGCAFCKSNRTCFRYDVGAVVNTNCKTSDIQWQTCVGNVQVWIIVVAVLAGIILLAVLITIWCLCRKCKHRRIRKVERRQAQDDQRMEERRAAAEVRTADRNRVADQIRMKYGILKANDAATDYTRIN